MSALFWRPKLCERPYLIVVSAARRTRWFLWPSKRIWLPGIPCCWPPCKAEQASRSSARPLFDSFLSWWHTEVIKSILTQQKHPSATVVRLKLKLLLKSVFLSPRVFPEFFRQTAACAPTNCCYYSVKNDSFWGGKWLCYCSVTSSRPTRLFGAPNFLFFTPNSDGVKSNRCAILEGLHDTIC